MSLLYNKKIQVNFTKEDGLILDGQAEFVIGYTIIYWIPV